MTTVAEHGLISAARVACQSVGPVLVSLHRTVRGLIHVEPHTHHTPRGSGIVARPSHQTGYFVVPLPLLCAPVGSVGGVGVNPDVVSIFHTELTGVVRIDVGIPFADPGHAPVAAIWVGKRSENQRQDIHIYGRGVRSVSILRRNEGKPVSVVAQRVAALAHLAPRQHDVSDLKRLNRCVVFGNIVRGGWRRIQRRMGAPDDQIGQIRRAVHRFAIDRKVLTVLNELRLIPVKLTAPAAGVPWLALLCLLPADHLGVGPHQCERRNAFLRFGFQIEHIVAFQTGAVVGNTLQIDINTVLEHEAPVVFKAPFTGKLAESARHAGQNLDIGAGVVHSTVRRPRVHRDERIRHRSGDVRVLELRP